MGRLGIMGGSFNPIHHGHLIVAQRAAEQLKLDRLVFIPAWVSPLKEPRDLASAEHRLTMVRLAIRGHRLFTASDVELKRGGQSYTYDTVETFDPKDDIFLIVGDDVLAGLPRWYRIHELARRVTFAVAARPGQFEPPPAGPWELRRLRAPLIEISASEIRQCVKRGLSVRYLTPHVVDLYIRRHGLYA
jgi:nicotinate-nucleotide adenylyltransferase